MAIPSLEAVTIETPRLQLVPTSEAYAQEVFAYFTPAITSFLRSAPPATIDDTRKFLRGARAGLEAGTDLMVAIFLKENREFIGHAGVHRLGSPTPELGIWIKESAHHRGYGHEVIEALCAWAFDNLKVDYLVYGVDRRNIPSRRIVECLGGQVAAEYHTTSESNTLLDLLEYHIYPAEFAAATQP